jgi:hypothetical protein
MDDTAKPIGFRAQGQLGNVLTKAIATPIGFRAQGALGEAVAKVNVRPNSPDGKAT